GHGLKGHSREEHEEMASHHWAESRDHRKAAEAARADHDHEKAARHDAMAAAHRSSAERHQAAGSGAHSGSMGKWGGHKVGKTSTGKPVYAPKVDNATGHVKPHSQSAGGKMNAHSADEHLEFQTHHASEARGHRKQE